MPEEEEFYGYIEPVDNIAAAYNALCAISDLDPVMLSKSRAKMIETIRTKSLEIIHASINDIHSQIFETKSDE